MDDDAFQIVRLTSPGRGAVATVAVEGPGAANAVTRILGLSPDKLADALPVDSPRLRRLRDAADGTEEDLVALRLDDERFRLHGHGGEAAVDRTVRLLTEQGGQVIDADRWIESCEDLPIRAAARQALVHAPTLKTARILLDQYHGRLDEEFAAIESEIDAGDRDGAIARINRLLDMAPLGLHLTWPWRVVLAGPPNAGKSSLINAMLGYDRAIVTQTPGTTRDAVEAETAVGGWPVTLIDTAGIRETADPIESAGVERTDVRLKSADLVLLVFDCSEPVGPAELELIEQHSGALHVWNKMDLRPEFATGEDNNQSPDAIQDLRVSAKTGEGIDQLLEQIAKRLVPQEPEPGAAIPLDEQQVERLVHLKRQLES